jgi:membrane-anchored protein YejM (alkaline phosphatase superfamily)
VTEVTTRKALFRWMGWFAIANALVLAAVGLRYFSGYVPGGTVLSWIYLLTIYPAHHVMVSAGPLFLLLTPVALLFPRRKLVTGLAVLLFALMVAVIMLDSLLWSQSRFHINGLTLQILGWQSWVFVAVIFLIGLFFESMLAGWTWQWVEGKPRRKGRLLGILSVLAIVVSQFIHAWADASYYVPVTSVGQQLPVYEGFTAKGMLMDLGLVDPQQSRERQVARRLARELESAADRVLEYPLNPLQCSNDEPLNLLIIMADAMRADMLDEQTAPQMHAFSKRRGQVFRRHLSGGNSSRMGVFSFFYGLPPGYWSSFESLQRSSVLIDELQNQDYQLGLFSSATMYRPVTLDRTAFANVPELRLQTEPASAPAWERDEIMTSDWFGWLDEREADRPFFGFLFYDSANSKVHPEDYPVSFPAEGDDEMAQMFARYKASTHFADSLIGRVLDDLESRGLVDNTVVIITSDHGEEFDDSGHGLKDHGSGYTRYQLETPMVIAWPGRAAAEFSHRTSHYDIVPTLMQEMLGCSNPATDFASGNNLFSGDEWAWLLAGSYYNYAVLEPDQITVTYPNGNFEVRDWDYRISPDPKIRGAVLEAVSSENSRFYRR